MIEDNSLLELEEVDPSESIQKHSNVNDRFVDNNNFTNQIDDSIDQKSITDLSQIDIFDSNLGIQYYHSVPNKINND